MNENMIDEEETRLLDEIRRYRQKELYCLSASSV